MSLFLLLISFVIVLCVGSNQIFAKKGIPLLLVYILLGMAFGSDGIFGISFDDYALAEQVCSFALIFIMMYGGFGTNWKAAKPIAVPAVILSSLGTVATAGLVGLFCWLILGFEPLEAFLIGSVISSTDAASVFYILRSKRLNLKHNTASLLEVESGSNDPFSYMLTVVTISLIAGQNTPGVFIWLVTKQIVLGILCGVGIAWLTKKFLDRFPISLDGFNSSFMVAVALLAYAVPDVVGGNGYLSVYITGIILGNCRLSNKQELVHFFDGITGLMQIALFFLLGLLCFPSQIWEAAPVAMAIALFLTFVARPIAIFGLMFPMKNRLHQKLLISWAGLRGAASIVFAIMAVQKSTIGYDLFHIVFFIVLFSILLQGSFLPVLAKKLKMIDDTEDVRKTFTDYAEETPVQFIEFTLPVGSVWAGKAVRDISWPPESLLVLVHRGGKQIIPDGNTLLEVGDRLILSGLTPDAEDALKLTEREIDGDDEWKNRQISDLHLHHEFVVLIKRGESVIIPRGNTIICEGDILVLSERPK